MNEERTEKEERSEEIHHYSLKTVVAAVFIWGITIGVAASSYEPDCTSRGRTEAQSISRQLVDTFYGCTLVRPVRWVWKLWRGQARQRRHRKGGRRPNSGMRPFKGK